MNEIDALSATENAPVSRDAQKLAYEVGEAGWALLRFLDEGEEQVFAVSYLHDSLAHLADAALHLCKGGQSIDVVFMDEPGEVHLFAQGCGDLLRYELRGYGDWASWGITAMDDYQVLAQGEIRRHDLVFNIHRILDGIHRTLGPQEYRKRWVEHDFPLDAHRRLAGIVRKKRNE
jgi:hypothetical protein